MWWVLSTRPADCAVHASLQTPAPLTSEAERASFATCGTALDFLSASAPPAAFEAAARDVGRDWRYTADDAGGRPDKRGPAPRGRGW